VVRTAIWPIQDVPVDDGIDVGRLRGLEVVGHPPEDLVEDLPARLACHALGQLLVGDLGDHRGQLLGTDVVGLGTGCLGAHLSPLRLLRPGRNIASGPVAHALGTPHG
jgi:hypothetical protein